MFAKGRNEIQASIDDMALGIKNLAYEIDSFYSSKIQGIESEINDMKEHDVDAENAGCCLCNSTSYQLLDIYNGLHIEAMEAIVSKVYSYAEKHMQMMVESIGYDLKHIHKEYKADAQPCSGVSDIEKMFYIINKHYCLPFSEISDVWSNYYDIHMLRKNIEHRYDYEKRLIKIEYIIQNIEQIEEMLKAIEISIRTVNDKRGTNL
ncbi:MAG: hypothetical protein J6V20_01995 [Bacteroidaceae bacterium]|nr:hypothetical protein [Bacteroidaceae bacterium]